MCVIIRMHQIIQHVHVTPCVCIGEITKHFLFQSSIESFYDGSLQIFVFARLRLYAVTIQHGLQSRIQKFRAFVFLHHVTLFVCQNLFECFDDVSRRLSSNRYVRLHVC